MTISLLPVPALVPGNVDLNHLRGSALSGFPLPPWCGFFHTADDDCCTGNFQKRTAMLSPDVLTLFLEVEHVGFLRGAGQEVPADAKLRNCSPWRHSTLALTRLPSQPQDPTETSF